MRHGRLNANIYIYIYIARITPTRLAGAYYAHLCGGLDAHAAPRGLHTIRRPALANFMLRVAHATSMLTGQSIHAMGGKVGWMKNVFSRGHIGSGIKSASHAEGHGFKSQCVHYCNISFVLCAVALHISDIIQTGPLQNCGQDLLRPKEGPIFQSLAQGWGRHASNIKITCSINGLDVEVVYYTL